MACCNEDVCVCWAAVAFMCNDDDDDDVAVVGSVRSDHKYCGRSSIVAVATNDMILVEV